MKTISQLIAAVTFALSATAFAVPSNQQLRVYSQTAEEQQTVAEGGSDHTPGFEVAEDGADRTPGFKVAEDGSDRTPGFKVAEDGSDRTPGFKVAEGGSDRTLGRRQA